MKHLYTLITLTFITLSGLGQLTLSDSLIAYYQFSGNTSDSSGNGYHGVGLNGVSLTTDRFGNPNSAYEFDGVDDHILCGNVVDLSTQTGLTISAWFSPDNISFDTRHGGIHIGRKEDGRVGLRIKTETNTIFQAQMGDAGENNSASAMGDNSASYNTWYHVVGTYEDNNMNLYIDGIMQTTTGSTGGSIGFSDIPANSDLYIGITYVDNNAERFYHGKLDDIRIYNRVLTQNEISTLFNTAVGIDEPTEPQNIDVSVYPNPASDNLTVQLSKAGNYNVEMYNSIGQRVLQTNLSGAILDLDLNKYSNGIYFVNIKSDSGYQITKKVIIRK